MLRGLGDLPDERIMILSGNGKTTANFGRVATRRRLFRLPVAVHTDRYIPGLPLP